MEKDWFDIAEEHLEESNYSQALFAITKYIAETPTDKIGKLLKAKICCDLSNVGVTMTILKEIEMVETDEPGYKLNYLHVLGKTYEQMGKLEDAIILYDKIIELRPNETMGYIFKGGCLAKSGQYELAKAEHLKATTLDGDKEEAFYNLALIYRAEMNFSEAKICCEKSLEIDPDDESVRHCLNDIIETIKLTEQYALKIE